MSNKIRINTAPGADRYAGPDERIIEFSSPNGGGLISFKMRDDGALHVDVYRTDDTVTVSGPTPDAGSHGEVVPGTCSQCGPGHDRGDGRCTRHGKAIGPAGGEVARPVDAYRLNAALAVSVERARAARAAGRDLALPEGINVATWADGWGRWHARVDFPEPGVSSEVADVNAGRLLDMARRAVRNQVAARQGDQDPTVSVVPESREVGADGRTLTLKFVEAAT